MAVLSSWFGRMAGAMPSGGSWTRWPAAILGGLALLLAAWIAIFLVAYHVDDDPNLEPAARFAVPGGSQAVAMTATLMDRALQDGWAPSELWYHPAAHSRNMKSFQLGEQYAVSRFVSEFTEKMGHDQGSGDLDRDLMKARGYFNYDPTSWALISSGSAVTQYTDGIASLEAYNQRLAAGQARINRLPVALSGFLADVNSDLQSQSRIIELTVMEPGDFTEAQKKEMTDADRARLGVNGGYFDGRAADIFYASKGRLYAYYLILKALGEDYREAIAAKHAESQWEDLVSTLRTAATYKKFLPANGARGDYSVPNDLVWQGYLLGRVDNDLGVLVVALRS
jgi:hypothetical protein